jgi:hypothetical protein
MGDRCRSIPILSSTFDSVLLSYETGLLLPVLELRQMSSGMLWVPAMAERRDLCQRNCPVASLPGAGIITL